MSPQIPRYWTKLPPLVTNYPLGTAVVGTRVTILRLNEIIGTKTRHIALWGLRAGRSVPCPAYRVQTASETVALSDVMSTEATPASKQYRRRCPRRRPRTYPLFI